MWPTAGQDAAHENSPGSGCDPELWTVAETDGQLIGLDRAALDVDVDVVTTTLDLYCSVGMVQVPNFTVWATSMPGALSSVDRHDAATSRGGG